MPSAGFGQDRPTPCRFSAVTTLRGLAQLILTLMIFWAPGYAILVAAGISGRLRRAAVAPVLTLGVFVAGSLAAAQVHARWTLPLALGCSSAVAVLLMVLRGRPLSPADRVRWRSVWMVIRTERVLAAVLASAALFQLVPVWKPILLREQVANLPDVQFHFNALQYVRLEGVSDPRTLASLIDPSGSTALYPNAWHTVAGVVPVLLDNTSLMAAASFAVIAVAWSVGLTALAREVVVGPHGRMAMTLAAAMSACGFSSPLEPALSLGIVPDAVGLALVPGAAALLVAVSHSRPLSTSRKSSAAILVFLLVLGLGGCHPSALAGAAILALPWVVTIARRWLHDSGGPGRLVGVAAGVVALGAAAYWVATDPLLAGVRSSRNEATTGLGDALIGLVFGFTWEAATVGLVVPVLAAVAWALRLRRHQDHRPLMSAVLVGAVYVLAATDVAWAHPVTGFFYVESRRVAPLVAIWAVVLGAEGLTRASRWVVGRTELPASVPTAAVLSFISVVVIATASWQPLVGLLGTSRDVYTTTLSEPVAGSSIVPFFTSGELAMVDRLPSELPPGSVLFGSGKSGVSYVYGLVGIRALPFARGLPSDLVYAGTNIARIATDPRVCDALRAHGVTHLYTDHDLWKAAGWPVLADPFGAVPATQLRLMDEGGNAKVYQITGCGDSRRS